MALQDRDSRMVSVSAALAVVKEFIAACKRAAKTGLIDRLRADLGMSRRIIILGSMGVGKTNLRNSLVDSSAKAIDAGARTEFLIKDVVRINGGLISLVDTPGAEEQSPRRLDAIRKALNRGVSGVINVVCYGYHEYEAGRDSALVLQLS